MKQMRTWKYNPKQMRACLMYKRGWEVTKAPTFALGMTFTATCWPLNSPFLNTAEQVYPKCPRPTSSPTSNLLVNSLENPNLLSRSTPSSSSPSSGIATEAVAFFPSRRASTALMCLAGDGGGKGRRKNRLGVEAALLLLVVAGDFLK